MNKLYYFLLAGAMIYLTWKDRVKPAPSGKFAVVLRVDGLNTIGDANLVKDTLGRKCEELDVNYAVAAGFEEVLK